MTGRLRTCGPGYRQQVERGATECLTSDEGMRSMGLGTSIVVFAIGAIMRFAVTVSTTGFNVHTVGVILMIVGAVGFLLSLAFGVRGAASAALATPHRILELERYPRGGSSHTVDAHSRRCRNCSRGDTGPLINFSVATALEH